MTVKKSSTSKKKTASETSEDDKAKKKSLAPIVSKPKKVKEPGAVPAKSRKKKEEVEEEEAPVRSMRPFITPPAASKAQPVVAPPKPVVKETPSPVVSAPPPSPAAPAQAPAAVTAPKAPEKLKPAAPPPPAQAPQQPKHKPAPRHEPHHARPQPAPTPVQEPKKPAAPKIIPPKPAPVQPVVAASAPAASTRKKLVYNEMMSVKDLATAMDVKVPDVIKKLLSLGTPASINQRLETDTATLIADAFGFDLEVKSLYIDEADEKPEPEGLLKSRPPVVTVMGHVDHGKTSLLDAIRSASVTEGEAGGITQHIGAYQVRTPKGVITFLDTPGHEAFTAMRARGAMVTDLVILVVAADDSVMPQTIEAIDHAKAANVPIVVAINKVDLPTANVQKVKQELAQHNLVAEDWGGKTVMVEVSAKTRKNIDKLLEMILLEAELLELKANPDRTARGVVLEAKLDPKRGITATILVQAGTLKVGDIVVCGLSSGRIRAMINDLRQSMDATGPATPAEILGLNQVPQVGDQFSVVNNDREAREIAERRKQFVKDASEKKMGHLSLESLHTQIAEGKIQDLPVILKADMQGSLQAIQDSLGKLSTTSIHLRFVHTGTGNINESDVLLAEASDAIVFGFHVKVEGSAETEAKRGGVDIRTYQIIYEMLADVKAAMEGLLKPEEREVVKGRALVKDTFASSRYGMVAGCMVSEGKITRGSKARVVRGSQVIATGAISSLRRFKEDEKEVEKGFECGLSVEGMKSFQRGDVIEAFVIEKHARRLEA